MCAPNHAQIVSGLDADTQSNLDANAKLRARYVFLASVVNCFVPLETSAHVPPANCDEIPTPCNRTLLGASTERRGDLGTTRRRRKAWRVNFLEIAQRHPP
jgi:hypothetical protein